MSVKTERPYFWAQPSEELQEAQATQIFLTATQRAALNRVQADEWVLVKNEIGSVVGGDPKCRRCGAIHEYITVGCIELPFSSLRSLEIFVGKMPQSGQELFRAMLKPGTLAEPGTLVPISSKEAEKLNERIRAKRMPTILEQRPLKRGEVDAQAIERRIVTRALSLRDGRIRR